MSNWVGVSRTNYFAVFDDEAFKARMAEIGGIRVVDGDDGTVAIFGIEGEWPSNISRDVGDDAEVFTEDEPVDIIKEVSNFLMPRSIAVFTTAGYEGERYVTGDALAVNADGETVEIDIMDIYKLAKERWGVEPTRAEF